MGLTVSLFSPTTDGPGHTSTCDCTHLHVITPTGAPFSPLGADNLAACRDRHTTQIHSERLLSLLNTHTHARTQVLTRFSHIILTHTLTNRCCPGIGGLSCVFILKRRLPDSEAGLDSRKETEGRD